MRRQTMQAITPKKIATIAVAIAGLGLLLWAIPASAQSSYGTGTYDPWSALRPSAPAPAPLPPSSNQYPAYRPFFSVPRYYPGGGYYDLKRYGDPNSRDALDSCSYC